MYHEVSTYHWSQVETQQYHQTEQLYDPAPIHQDCIRKHKQQLTNK